jgi:hypothetical protein
VEKEEMEDDEEEREKEEEDVKRRSRFWGVSVCLFSFCLSLLRY